VIDITNDDLRRWFASPVYRQAVIPSALASAVVLALVAVLHAL
jgi:hypothetical protein